MKRFEFITALLQFVVFRNVVESSICDKSMASFVRAKCYNK